MEKQNPIIIVVSKRGNDYHACIKGHSEIWGCGDTPNEAIGSLVKYHNDKFGLDIEFDIR